MADSTTVQYEHRFAVLDENTQTTYPWTLTLPFALNLTADNVNTITQIIAAGLPANPYGWKVTATITDATTTVSTTSTTYPDINVPAA